MARKKFNDAMVASALNALPLGPHRIRLAANVLCCSHATVWNFVHRFGIQPLYVMVPVSAPIAPPQDDEPLSTEIEIAISMDDCELFGEPIELTDRDREMIKLHEALLEDDAA